MQTHDDGVPDAGRSLLPLVKRWGLQDDYERETAVGDASSAELSELVSAVDELEDEFWDWLVGPESSSTTPSDTYVVLTCVTMAADSARIEIQLRAARS